MRKIIKTTILVIALATSPVLAGNVEAQQQTTRVIHSPSGKNHQRNDEIFFVLGVLVSVGISWWLFSDTDSHSSSEETGQVRVGEDGSIEFKPTVNFDSETSSLSYGVRYTIPLE